MYGLGGAELMAILLLIILQIYLFSFVMGLIDKKHAYLEPFVSDTITTPTDVNADIMEYTDAIDIIGDAVKSNSDSEPTLFNFNRAELEYTPAILDSGGLSEASELASQYPHNTDTAIDYMVALEGGGNSCMSGCSLTNGPNATWSCNSTIHNNNELAPGYCLFHSDCAGCKFRWNWDVVL
tara:strand:- start:754 stop:1296 length:543 start_codon:yes stop_codon:yes gene_type:complete